MDSIELPQLDDVITKENPFGILETSKAVTDLIAPISGTVLDRNDLLTESPENLTDDPYGDGWLIPVEPSDPDELDSLMKSADYQNLVKEAVEE